MSHMSEPLSYRVRANGIELQVYEWPGEGRPIFLAHATGFCARCWDQVVAHLPGRHVFAPDMRGHGLSEHTAPYTWPSFDGDTLALVRELGLEGAVGAGHSKGGHAVTYAAAHEPRAFAALVLFDPVILPRAFYGQPAAEGEHFAARRRDHWASKDEMFERFRGRPPFDRWDPLVLRDYCDYGLVPAPDGHGFVLACPPTVEAAVYRASSEGDIYPDIERITVPVRVLRARQRDETSPYDMSSSPTAPDLASHFAQGADVFLPEMSHFIPMEDPALAARHILELAAEVA